MIPDGSANYPYDHTTGAPAGTIFFSGCNGGSFSFQGPFELRQDIDVSSDAVTIDTGLLPYTFSGYLQTPVSNQTDQGRFIVDFMDATNTVLGSSYTSAWQSFFLGSGAGWNFHSNTRIAPVGTRTIRIKLQTEIQINQPAINVYFDDISLTRPVALPVNLISFTAKAADGEVYLTWKTENEINFSAYDVEQSSNGVHFTKLATIMGGKAYYSFTDKIVPANAATVFYRLKITDNNGKFSYSHVVPVNLKKQTALTISPNPAKNLLTVVSNVQHGLVTIYDANGRNIMSTKINSFSSNIDVSHVAAGIYFVRFSDGKTASLKKLIIHN